MTAAEFLALTPEQQGQEVLRLMCTHSAPVARVQLAQMALAGLANKCNVTPILRILEQFHEYDRRRILEWENERLGVDTPLLVEGDR